MKPDLATRFLEGALSKLLFKDLAPKTPEGFPRTIGERPLVFRLAHYLIADGVEKYGLHVDCDYNRHGSTYKELPSKAEPDMSGDIPDNLKPRRFFPDIVVHRRGERGLNTLVCEIKRVGDRRNPQVDRDRLSLLTIETGTFRYKLGAFIQIDQTALKIAVEYFVNGELESAKSLAFEAAHMRSIKY